MVAYVIIPGIDGSDGQHWQTAWERQWGGAAVRTAPASWSAPELGDWTAAVGTAYDAAARQDDRVALVAHSLGCWAATAWLALEPARPVAGALLVAPPDPRGPAFPREAAATFTGLDARPVPCPALVVAGADDPYCTPEAAAGFAAGWQARWHLEEHGGHLNSASNLGSWPVGQRLLESLLQT
ncbi:RBBP9/YdeN family alpha/beta hydrolase [Streptomyces sp. NPDC049813]|uniref:RBBP9/YdeN family alpha/beta hydrolase n=1 Tax=Streptomyces sp. NPDC049813 TaxID=3365597 RepID=UPI0037AF0C2A